jgi:hypothetical protein
MPLLLVLAALLLPGGLLSAAKPAGATEAPRPVLLCLFPDGAVSDAVTTDVI